MRFEQNFILKLMLLTLTFSISSCETEEYPVFLNDGEEASLGEVKSLEIRSGNNRVMVKGYIEDPDVAEVKIFWDDRSESVVVPLSNSSGVDTIQELITGLEERLYVFEVQTFDAEGNASEVVSAGAEVFGSNFATRAGNRQVLLNSLRDSLLEVTFSPVNMSSGIVGTEFIYENTSGENEELFLRPEQNSLSISDYKSGSTYKYRSLFIPSLMALDTIYTEYDENTPVALPQLKNATAPFEVAEAEGRWGTLAEWISNDAVKNHNGFGGWDSRNGFNIESGWGAPGITNGKIYQTVTAGAASFSLNVEFVNHNHSEEDEGGFYIVIAKGDGLPDVENLTTAPEVLGYERVISGKMNYSVNFTVDEMTEISVGVVTTQGDNGRYGPIRSFSIGPATE